MRPALAGGFTAPFSTMRVSRWLRRRWREYWLVTCRPMNLQHQLQAQCRLLSLNSGLSSLRERMSSARIRVARQQRKLRLKSRPLEFKIAEITGQLLDLP